MRPMGICNMAHLPLCGGQCIDPHSKRRLFKQPQRSSWTKVPVSSNCGGKTREECSRLPPRGITSRCGRQLLSYSSRDEETWVRTWQELGSHQLRSGRARC